MCIIRDGRPVEGPVQPIEVRAWGGEDTLYSELLNTSAHVAAPGPHDEGLRHSHNDEASKRRHKGRPVKYQGDPDAPGLNPEQRRQLLRRISNRESARRTRVRHQEELAGSYVKAKDLSDSCKRLTAQVDALKGKCSQSDALEKRLNEQLRVKDEQMGKSERQSNSLQSEIRELTLRLYAKEQDALRLEMCLGMHGCRPAMRPPCGLLPCTDILCEAGSESPSQTWNPYKPSGSAAQDMYDDAWPPLLDHAMGEATCPPGLLRTRGRAGPTRGMSVPDFCDPVSSVSCESRQNGFPRVDMELPDFSNSSEDDAQGGFTNMMRELGLLVDVETGAKTAFA